MRGDLSCCTESQLKAPVMLASLEAGPGCSLALLFSAGLAGSLAPWSISSPQQSIPCNPGRGGEPL